MLKVVAHPSVMLCICHCCGLWRISAPSGPPLCHVADFFQLAGCSTFRPEWEEMKSISASCCRGRLSGRIARQKLASPDMPSAIRRS